MIDESVYVLYERFVKGFVYRKVIEIIFFCFRNKWMYSWGFYYKKKLRVYSCLIWFCKYI